MYDRTETRLAILRNGYTPLPNTDKLCQLTGWPTIDVTEAEILRWDRMESYEATGLRIDNGLAVFDFDVDHPMVHDLFDLLLDTYPELEDCLMRRGGGHKEAWFFEIAEGDDYPRLATPSYDGGEGLMVESFGGATRRQFGAMGWHTRGERSYQWHDDRSPATVPMDELPCLSRERVAEVMRTCDRWLSERFDRITEEGVRETSPSSLHDLTDDMLFDTREDGTLTLDQLRRAVGGARGYYYCSASFADGPVATNRRRCTCSIGHDGGLTIWDSMTEITHHEASLEQAPITERAAAAADRLRAAGVDLPEADPIPEHRLAGGPEYQFEGRGDGTYISPNMHNAMQIGIHHEIAREVSFDAFSRIFYHRGRMLDEHQWDTIIARVQGSDRAMRRMGTKVLRDGIKAAAVAHRSFHPVRDYLSGVQWDGTGRLDGVSGYLGIPEPSDFVRVALRRWMISAVARVMQPGCKADHMLILIGDQGVGKSSFFSALGGDWHSEDLPSVSSKDAKSYLLGRWIVEIAELAAIRGKEAEHTKSFLSLREDRFRKAYAADEDTLPRQCVFAGSSNHREFLTDATGGRRFWPIAVGRIDLDRVHEDRDQLWAEAMAAYLAGEAWWIERDEQHLIDTAIEAQEGVYEVHEDEGRILEWCRDYDEVTTRDIYEAIFFAPGDPRKHGPMPRHLTHVIKEVMNRGGWVIGKTVRGTRYWVRTEKAAPRRHRQAPVSVLQGEAPPEVTKPHRPKPEET